MDLDRALADAGLDVVHAFDLRAHALDGFPLPDRRVGLLIGNTRALWPRFLAARRDEPDPLDRHVERALEAFGAIYAHRTYAGAYVPVQRIAIATGLAAPSPSGLLVHPIYGQWFGLRAIVAIDGDPPHREPLARACTCTSACDPPRDPLAWRAWVAVRDACAIGRTHRYSDAQIAYHSTTAVAYLAAGDAEYCTGVPVSD
ncbi:MAG: hypothetical protein NT062_23140 [Proteobacteria bacterium]|nr:hypothetical protein [Pseudomonadota bacterium]